MGCLVIAPLAAADVTAPCDIGGAPGHEGEIVGGKFRLERVLGEGGMGVVYAAVHLDLVKHVAIKIIRDEYAMREDVVERMLNEARSAAKLRSEHVAHVLDVGQLDNGAPYIVMDYLDGCDLAAHLIDGRLPAEEAVLYVLQACEAVAEAHALGIVHRDLKPENLFLSTRADGEPIVKVLDFGISKPTNDPTTTGPGLVIGSPDYMSPEAVRGEVPNTSTDIWSLGAVLYELITGTRPFDAPTVKETWQRILSVQPQSPRAFAPALHSDLEAVMLRCLAKNTGDRFASVADLAAALSPFGPEGSADLARRVARVASSVRWQPRSTLSNAPRVRLDSASESNRVSGVNRRDSAPATSITAPARPSMITVQPPKRSRAMAWLALASTLAAAALGLLLIRDKSLNKHRQVEAAVVSGRTDSAIERAATTTHSPTTAAQSPATAVPTESPTAPAEAADTTREPELKQAHKKAGPAKRRTESKAKSLAEAVPTPPAAQTEPVDASPETATAAIPGADEPQAPAAPQPPAPTEMADPYDSATFGGRK